MNDATPQLNSYDADQLAPLRRGIRYGSIGVAILAVVGLALWGWIDGTRGLWGALIGAAIGGGFILSTIATVLLTARMSPHATMAALLGSWLLKVVIVIAIVASIRSMDFYSKPALATVIIASIVIVLGAEAWGVMTARTPYTNPVESRADQHCGTDYKNVSDS